MELEKFLELANKGDASVCEYGEKLAEKLDGHEKGRLLGSLGNLYFKIGEFEKAEEKYLQALNLYIDLAKKDERFLYFVAGCLFNLGNLYQTIRNYEEAEKSYRDALSVLKFFDDKNLRFEVLSALGLLSTKIGKDKEAEEAFLSAIKIKETATVLNNVAVIYIKQGKKEEAKKLLLRAFELEKNPPILQNLLLLGEALEDLEKYPMPPELMAKVKYLKAKNLERSGKDASSEYLEAASLSFIAFKNGIQSVNYIHCLEKIIEAKNELSEIAESMKNAIMRLYFGMTIEVNLEPLQKLKEREDFIGLATRIILEDWSLVVS